MIEDDTANVQDIELDIELVEKGGKAGGDSPLPVAAELAPCKPAKYDYDEAPTPGLCEKDQQGYGTGKCGLTEIRLGGCAMDGPHVLRPIIFNPWASLIGAAILWGFTIYCIVSPEAANTKLGAWQTWCTVTFSWFYIASQEVWIVFLALVYYYFGSKKLGKQHEIPEYDNLTYFAMVFSAGVAVGLFVYGTAEPLYHYDYWVKNRFNGDESNNDNDKANYAMLLTLYHWGFHGFCVYTLVGITMGVMCYQHNLPLLMRTAFYPLLGRHTWGWIGDCIDGFSIVTIVAGVCTSLGLGTLQIYTGLQGMGALPEDCDLECQKNTYMLVIWGITAIATVSVITGLDIGIKILARTAFGLGVVIWMAALFMGDTWFYLNNMSQSTGYYLQYFLTELGWHTDAFAQLNFGAGGSPDSTGAGSVDDDVKFASEGSGASKADQAFDGAQTFMDAWTIFYWGWWIAWSPFVGMFIARISRGRTIREVCNYTLTLPLLYAILWFGVFGGAAIQMENNAQLLWQAGADLYNDPSYFQTGQHGNPQSSFGSAFVGNAVQFRMEPCFGTGIEGYKCYRCGAWGEGATGGTDAAATEGCEWNAATAEWNFLKLNVSSGETSLDVCKPFCDNPAIANTTDAKGELVQTFTKDSWYRDGQPCIPHGAVAGKSEACGACFVQQANFDAGGMTGCDRFKANPNNKGRDCPLYIKLWKADPERTPQCLFTDYDQEASWYNVVNQFYDFGPFLCGLSIGTLVLYFVTSSDSGSLVVDTLSANGRDEQNPMQRVFWALTEGAVSCALIISGIDSVPNDAPDVEKAKAARNVLKALRAASICAGLPYTFLLCFMMPSLWYALSEQKRKGFKTPIFGGVFDYVEYCFSFGKSPLPSFHNNVVALIPAILTPGYSMFTLNRDLGFHPVTNFLCAFFGAICYYVWFVFSVCIVDDGYWKFGWVFFVMFALILATTRQACRHAHGVAGNMCEDIFSSLFFYPQVIMQCLEAVKEMPPKIE